MNSTRARTLEELDAQFSEIATRASALANLAGEDLCTTRPAPESWSAGECLEHLNVSADAYFPVWQQMIAAAGPRTVAPDAQYEVDFWGKLLCWILDPPPRFKSKTTNKLVPTKVKETGPVLAGFLERQERIAGTLRGCQGRAIDKVKIPSPVDARIHYSIWSSFVVTAAHQRRHLWQAEQAIHKLRAD